MMAKCKQEPRGRNGLEGYNLGDQYHYHEVVGAGGKEHVRVYPTEGSGYYETCGPIVFKRYFKKEDAHDKLGS